VRMVGIKAQPFQQKAKARERREKVSATSFAILENVIEKTARTPMPRTQHLHLAKVAGREAEVEAQKDQEAEAIPQRVKGEARALGEDQTAKTERKRNVGTSKREHAVSETNVITSTGIQPLLQLLKRKTRRKRTKTKNLTLRTMKKVKR
jgi:hypothetical protein